ncbi:MAG TPA: metalloregulator ArsR/SmtB family transcription factor [Candidatus Sulfotelmatobacter sp.]
MTAPEPSLDRVLHAIADPTRRRILQTLKERGACTGMKSSTHKSSAKNPAARDASTKGESLCAGDIETCVRLSQPTVSHHMAILIQAGLVEAVKRGQWRWYRRNDKAIGQIVKLLRKGI